MRRMSSRPFHGIYPMQYALFAADGTLDRAAMARQLRAGLASGAHGIAILGLATEVSKLSEAERHDVLSWAASDIDGRVPLAVTVFGATVDAQSAFISAAHGAGADWVILQPPVGQNFDEARLLRFFGDIADRSELPVAIQNAPEYLGVGLGVEAIAALRRNHENFVLLKGEAPAVAIREIIEATGGELSVFNGRAGMELPDLLRAECAGVIPSTDLVDHLVRVYDLIRSGNEEDEIEAERVYRQALPPIVFLMQSIGTLICYGKRIAARRLGLDPVFDREPALAPSEYGLECVRRYADALGALPTIDP